MAKVPNVSPFRPADDELYFDPTDQIARQSHPLYHNQYLMPTQSIISMSQKIALWLRKGITGGTFAGESGYGKTRGIKYVRTVRRELFGPGVAVVRIPMIKLPKRDRALWQYIASVLGFATMKARPVDIDMFNKSVAGLLGVCEESRANRLVLFIDDAQLMTHEHYLDLKPIYDALIDIHNKRVLVVSVGENALTGFVEDMKQDGKTAINRFLRVNDRFPGVSGDMQLEKVLDAYDSILQFPVGSGTSYTESLLPNAFASNFRLSSLAHVTNQLYTQLITNESDFDNQIMSMKTCTIFAQSILDELADIDCKGLKVDENIVKQALRDGIGSLAS